MKSDKKNIRVGVLTFHNGPNFGGVLQAWHMVHAIRSLGYTCHAVNYLHPTHHENNQIPIPLTSLSALKARAFWTLKKHGFRNFEDSICRHNFTDDIGQVPWDDFDVFVVGSDVIWNYEHEAFGRDPVYFGMIPQMMGKPIIAYAASAGHAPVSGPFPNYVSEGLANFEAIGVRDEATAELVRKASGREATIVVDPTWLSPEPASKWKGLPKRKYLFVYGGRADPELSALIGDYCRSNDLQFVSALTSCKGADKMYRVLDPFQWVELFRNAEATVVLGTLHGTVYSIKYGKPFILATSPTTTQKISSILDRVGHQNRLFEPGTVRKEDLSLLSSTSHPVPSIPTAWRKQSLDFLETSLAAASAQVLH